MVMPRPSATRGMVSDGSVDAAARLGHAVDGADRRLALVVFQLDLELGAAGAELCVVADVALGLSTSRTRREASRPGSRSRRRRICPLRIRVSRSPNGSLIECLSPYQLDLATPGICPCWRARAARYGAPSCGSKALGRPVISQRLRMRI